MHWDWDIAWLTFRFLMKVIVQIGVLATLLYWVMRLLKGTIVPTILYVLLTILTIGYGLVKLFKLDALQFLMERLFEYLPIFIVVLMGNELRKLMNSMSKFITDKFVPRKRSSWYDDMTISALCTEVVKMSLSKTGALIAIEQKMSLEPYIKNAKVVRATLEPGNSLLESIFFKGAPLHDGGVIIQKGVVAAASCVFPLSERPEIQQSCGMRHQAAHGMAENTDAVVIVVSEETGKIEVLKSNERTMVETQDELLTLLRSYMGTTEHKASFWLDDIQFIWQKLRAVFRLVRKKKDTDGQTEVAK